MSTYSKPYNAGSTSIRRRCASGGRRRASVRHHQSPHGCHALSDEDIPYITWEINPLDPELTGDEIYWPEGEKDVDTLGKLNLPAFTFGGVSDPLPANLSIFAGKRVVVLADNDDVGLKHAQKKVERAIDVAAAIKIVSFEQKDVSDYIAAGHIVEDLRQRVNTVPWNAAKKDAKVEQPKADNGLFSAEALNAMVFEPINYFVEGLIAEGLTLFAGKPKIGKSWMLLHMAHEVADGGYTLGGIPCVGGDVLYAALEDNKRRLQRRMTKLWARALGGHSQIHLRNAEARRRRHSIYQRLDRERQVSAPSDHRHAGHGPFA